jgi:hypothetical protein
MASPRRRFHGFLFTFSEQFLTSKEHQNIKRIMVALKKGGYNVGYFRSNGEPELVRSNGWAAEEFNCPPGSEDADFVQHIFENGFQDTKPPHLGIITDPLSKYLAPIQRLGIPYFQMLAAEDDSQLFKDIFGNDVLLHPEVHVFGQYALNLSQVALNML